jgi:hypothetical protein
MLLLGGGCFCFCCRTNRVQQYSKVGKVVDPSKREEVGTATELDALKPLREERRPLAPSLRGTEGRERSPLRVRPFHTLEAPEEEDEIELHRTPLALQPTDPRNRNGQSAPTENEISVNSDNEDEGTKEERHDRKIVYGLD